MIGFTTKGTEFLYIEMLEAKMAAYNRNKFESSINTPPKAWKTVNDILGRK